jgi:hypothetical protein
MGNNGGVRWSFVGVLVGVAFTCAWLASGGWLLERTVLRPDLSGEHAVAVMSDDAVRGQFAAFVAAATAEGMYPGDPNAPARVLATVDLVLTIPAGAELTAPTLTEIHSRLIGETEGPVQLSPQLLAQLVRDERAAALAPAAIVVPRIGALDTADRVLSLIVPIAAVAAVVLIILVALTRPERDVLVRTSGLGLLVLALIVVLFRHVVAGYVPPVLEESIWAEVPAVAARAQLLGTLLIAGGLAVVGLVLVLAAGRTGRRRRRSAPTSSYRYREQYRWS